jgi:hypothetical protein
MDRRLRRDDALGRRPTPRKERGGTPTPVAPAHAGAHSGLRQRRVASPPRGRAAHGQSRTACVGLGCIGVPGLQPNASPNAGCCISGTLVRQTPGG